jgi:hypothetical protein
MKKSNGAALGKNKIKNLLQPSIPLEVFLPSPSLSTTSSAHCTDRPFEVFPPLSRSTRGALCAICGGFVCVVVCDAVGACAARSCDCDMAQGFVRSLTLSCFGNL